MAEWIPILLQMLLGLIMAAPGVLAYRNQQVQVRTDASSKLVESALSLHERLQLECEDLAADVERLRAERDAQAVELTRLRGQVRELGRTATALVHQALGQGLQPVATLEEVVEIINN